MRPKPKSNRLTQRFSAHPATHTGADYADTRYTPRPPHHRRPRAPGRHHAPAPPAPRLPSAIPAPEPIGACPAPPHGHDLTSPMTTPVVTEITPALAIVERDS